MRKRTTHSERGPTTARSRLYHRERAQALIEFVLIAPIIFVFLFSIVDFGIAVDRRLVLQYAVGEGARFAAVHTTGSTIVGDIKQRTADEAQDVIRPSDVSVCYIDENGNNSPGDKGDAAKVSARYTWNFPILSELARSFGLGPLAIDISPSATSRLEQGVSGTTPTRCVS